MNFQNGLSCHAFPIDFYGQRVCHKWHICKFLFLSWTILTCISRALSFPKAFVTCLTYVWFHTFMNTLAMALQIVFFSKAFVTRITFQDSMFLWIVLTCLLKSLLWPKLAAQKWHWFKTGGRSKFPVTSAMKIVSNCREVTSFTWLHMSQSIFFYNLRYFSGF